MKRPKIGSVVPRTAFLRSIEGWYEAEASPLYRMYKESKFRGNFAKFLRSSGMPENIIKDMGTQPEGFEFKISCQYNDIMRCSTMYKHGYFNSCLAPGGINGYARAAYCRREPTIGILYVPDRAGHIKARAFVHNPVGTEKIVMLRQYGDVPWQRIKARLEGLLVDKGEYVSWGGLKDVHTYHDIGCW